MITNDQEDDDDIIPNEQLEQMYHVIKQINEEEEQAKMMFLMRTFGSPGQTYMSVAPAKPRELDEPGRQWGHLRNRWYGSDVNDR